MTTSELTVKTAQDDARLQAQLMAGALVVDSGRRRPYYFDGRFLTAADLTADQDYVRARQSDLAQAIGPGVIRGLMVGLGTQSASNGPTLVIEAGLGLTPSGDLVEVSQQQVIPVSSLPESTGLDAQLGLKVLPNASAVNRSGLFVLALRSIEFSANPTAAYPTTLDGQRTVRDGDIVEATAVTLIPYPDRAGVETAAAKRARVAREIFGDRQRPGALQQALPLAMICLEGGALRWLDVYMVRREVGAESTLSAGLAPRPRALLEAWLKQHQDHLDDIATAEVKAGFAAVKHFEVLPPVAPLPAAALRFEMQLGQLTMLQGYFPPLVDCEFAFVPSDELAALVSESLALPPIDLRAADDDLDHLSILIVAPVTRQQLEAHKRALQSIVRPVKAAGAGLVSKRSPFESLVRLSQPTPLVAPPALVNPTPEALAQAWQRAVELARSDAEAVGQGRAMFWYLRKRQLPYTAEIASTTLRLAGDAATIDTEVRARLVADGTAVRFDQFTASVATLTRAEISNLMVAPKFTLSPTAAARQPGTSDLLRLGVFSTLSGRAADYEDSTEGGVLLHEDVLQIARRFGDPKLGEGYDSLVSAADEATRTILKDGATWLAIGSSGVVPELDKAVRALPATRHAAFAIEVAAAATAPDSAVRLAALAGVKVT